MINFYKNKKGFTLLELLVAMGIFSFVLITATWFLVDGLRYNTIIWDQLEGQNDGRRVLQEVVNIVRRAEESSIGSYPIALADDNELIIYSNVDNDSYRERVRFWLEGTTLKKGIIKPSGDPLGYSGEESIVEIAHYVVNIAENTPVFYYYDEDYTGIEDPLDTPADTPVIRLIRIKLEIEKNPDKTPVPLLVESVVQVRNLKTN